MNPSPSFLSYRERWLQIAEECRPDLHRITHTPRDLIAIERDASAWQRWRSDPIAPANELTDKIFSKGEEFALDFGEYLVGYVSFHVEAIGAPVGAPLRLRIRFGERLCEIAENPDEYGGWLSRAWIQDEVITFDSLPVQLRLPRRYAFRYMRVQIADHSLPYQVRFTKLECETVSAIDANAITPLPPKIPDDLRAIDRAAVQTMIACSQTVVEDGAKRDRRMWMGDMRLCALANYVTVRQFNLIKRCLYLFAGLANEAGLISACVYENPAPTRGQDEIVDYSVLYAPALLEYGEASHDWATVRDLWPIARRQLEIVLDDFNNEGLFINPRRKWVFIDWNPDVLDTQAPAQGMIIYSFKAALQIANLIGDIESASWCEDQASWMRGAAIRHCWDNSLNLFVSGPSRQISWASQAWLTLAGVFPLDHNRRIFQQLIKTPDAIRPVTPSLYHHCVQAMLISGLEDEAWAVVREFWGGMITRGADAFWEVYDPADPFRSPYGAPLGHLVNSYCHAWSATPAALIRHRYG